MWKRAEKGEKFSRRTAHTTGEAQLTASQHALLRWSDWHTFVHTLTHTALGEVEARVVF